MSHRAAVSPRPVSVSTGDTQRLILPGNPRKTPAGAHRAPGNDFAWYVYTALVAVALAASALVGVYLTKG